MSTTEEEKDMTDEMILVPRAELLAWAKAWLDDYGPNDGTDCVTPFDTYLLKTPVEAQPVEWQYQDRNGKWHGFTDESHRLNTIEDGSWPVRALYDHPPPSAPMEVWGLPEKWRREAPRARVDVGEDASLAWREAVYWCAFQLEAALTQQPAEQQAEPDVSALVEALRYAVDNPEFNSETFDKMARAALHDHDQEVGNG